MNIVTCPPPQLNISQKVQAFIENTSKYLALCYSPKRTEFRFCAFLAAWESTACQDSDASHWIEIWQKHCRKRHRGKPGRTLADPVKAGLLSESWHLPKEEETKAFTKVKEGLRLVFKATLSHYYPGDGDFPPQLLVGTDESAILLQNIRASFKAASSFESPEAFEFFLLTLIQLFEQSLGTEEAKLFSRKAWRSEISRRRLGGPPETRTLADVAPADVRLARQNAFPEKERMEILKKMVSSMRQIVKELEAYLAKRTPS